MSPIHHPNVRTGLARIKKYTLCFGGLLLFFFHIRLFVSSAQTIDIQTQGRLLYEEYCAVCHGRHGDGQGEAASLLQVKPRDFTKGLYKIKSTPSGTLPLDEDLITSIKFGLPGTAMPPQPTLSDEEILSLVIYIKAFSPRFAQAKPGKPIPLSSAPPLSPERLQEGKIAYQKNQCVQCHGPEGKGNGVLAKDLTIKPADLTRRPLKVGGTAQEIARTILTGIDGTPMPSYQFIVDDKDLWNLAYYINSLGGPPQETEDERTGKDIVKKLLTQRRSLPKVFGQ